MIPITFIRDRDGWPGKPGDAKLYAVEESTALGFGRIIVSAIDVDIPGDPAKFAVRIFAADADGCMLPGGPRPGSSLGHREPERALREGGFYVAEKRRQRAVCRKCGYGVFVDTDDNCATCGAQCAIVEVIDEPEEWQIPNICGVDRVGDELDDDSLYECSLVEGHEGDHTDGHSGHRWARVVSP